MRSQIIARSYAATLLELADRHGGEETVTAYAGAMQLLAGLVREPRVREFLATPRVSAETRQAVLRKALEGRVPELFLRFVMVVVDKRRQALLGDIAHEYGALVDERQGRLRVQVSISHAPDAALQQEITRSLTQRLGREVIPAFSVEPELLGGMVVRYGDEILDGSLRTRAANLRRQMAGAALPRQ
jgi:F-type H+-transporting ATPase subunit delta